MQFQNHFCNIYRGKYNIILAIAKQFLIELYQN